MLRERTPAAASPSETEDLIKNPSPDTAISPVAGEEEADGAPAVLRRHRICAPAAEAAQWIRMLCRELSPTFVAAVAVVYGLSQGFAGSFFRVAADYYWKDVQKVQPADVQFFSVFYFVPWVMKPVWGVLTDVFPVYGYRRRPYFVFAGLIGTASGLVVSTATGLPVAAAVLCFVGISVAVAIADVTIDACIARNSIDKPWLAPDMQTLSVFMSSLGSLLGFATSGIFIHHLGAQGSLALVGLPSVLLVPLGFVLYEQASPSLHTDTKFWRKVAVAVKGMERIKHPAVWKPSLFMFLTLALSLSTHEGQFYWYTSTKPGDPGFSQEFVGVVYAVGAVASMFGVLIYHKLLKNMPFRALLFYAQLLFAASGMLDLVFVLRWNLRLGIPDPLFTILEECCGKIITKVRWMPMIVLSTKLCPPGVEGTFFALLMCIDSLGLMVHKTAGGALLQLLAVTRTDFRNLWLAVLIRNLLRMSTLGLVFLLPTADQTDTLIPPELMSDQSKGEEAVQLAKLEDLEDL